MSARMRQVFGSRLLNHLYGEIVRLRRRWYAEHPEARRRLRQPVISVGNLTVGGSGKTPLVAHLVQMLVDAGERPAGLSRGHAPRPGGGGGRGARAGPGGGPGPARAGGEPLMLARSLETAIVLSSPDRYLAGRLA